MQKGELQRIYKHSIYNRDEIQRSEICACFDCRHRFDASEIEEWTDKGLTAICPYCGTDAVIGDASGIPLTDELIEQLHLSYF